MKMCMKWLRIPICLCLTWGYAIAGEENQVNGIPTKVLEEIVVTADQENAAARDVIPLEEIQAPQISGSILDAMESQAGVQLIRRSQSGADGGDLRIRGFDETRLIIMKDGVTLNRDGSYGNGPVDWSSISPESIAGIEIYRGACPAKYGNTLGGIVNIIGKEPTLKPETSLSVSYGSLDTLNTTISHSWRKGPVGWNLSGGHFESDGYLRNNTLERDNFSGMVSVELPSEWEIGVGMDYAEKKSGNPVYNRPDSPYYDGSYPDADEKEIGGPGIGVRLINGSLAWGDDSKTEDENTNLTTFIEKKITNGKFRLDGRLWNQDRTETYYDAEDSSKKIYERETEAEDNNWSVKGEMVYNLSDHKIECGGETRQYGWGGQKVTYIDESYFNGSINFMKFIKEGFKGQEDIMHYHALYLQDTWSISRDFSVELGVRQEWFKAGSVDPDAFGFSWAADVTDISESQMDPRLALTWRPWNDASIVARWGIAHRYPTSGEYFWWYLNNATNYFNTDFNSEEAMQYELAWNQSLKGTIDLFVRGYYYDIDDYISSTSVPGVGSVYYNIGEVTIKGIETGFSAMLPYNFRFWCNFTFQDGDKNDDPWDADNQLSNELADFPDYMANAGIDYTKDKLKAKLWLNHVGDREHFDGDELKTLDSYTLVNISATWRFFEKKNTALDLELAGTNIFDESYEEESGYPMADACVMAGIRLTF